MEKETKKGKRAEQYNFKNSHTHMTAHINEKRHKNKKSECSKNPAKIIVEIREWKLRDATIEGKTLCIISFALAVFFLCVGSMCVRFFDDHH